MMGHRYQLIDMRTFEPVGAFDAFEEVEDVLKYDLEHNGPNSVRDLELFIGTGEFPDSSVAGDALLERAYRLFSTQVFQAAPDHPGVELGFRALVQFVQGTGAEKLTRVATVQAPLAQRAPQPIPRLILA